MDFTVASILPLLWGYHGKDVLCVKPHCVENVWNVLVVNCGPPSDQRMSRTAVRQNAERSMVMRWYAVVLVLIGMMSGQSV